MKMVPALRFLLLTAALTALTGCNAFDRINEIGDEPHMASVQDPTKTPGYVQVSMPMPPPSLNERQSNSLWQTGARAFFRDQRASRVGDILTVVVSVNDQALMANETQRQRTSTDTANLTNLFGYESHLHNWLPKAVDPASLVNAGSATDTDGKGQITRTDQVDTTLAATITQVLPNGNLVITGKQQMVVNFDMRELSISGVVRPQDISSENTVNWNQIAEARIEYSGKGQVMDIQQPRYGDQLFDILMPF